MLNIPTTMKYAERNFSKLKLLKSYLWSTMSQERLNVSTIIAIKNDRLKNIDYENLANNFVFKNAMRATRVL